MDHAAALRGERAARIVIAALAALLGAAVVHALAGFDAGPLSGLLERWGYNVVLAGASLACVARGVVVPRERAAWLLLGGSLLAWSAGNVYYTAALWDEGPVPIPSPSDALWVLSYPGAYVGLVLIVRARVPRFHASLWVDGVLAALAVAALSAAIVFQSVLRTTGGEPLEIATNLAYPLADLVLLGLVTGGIALTGWKPGASLGALAASYVSFGVSDSFYLFQNATGSWQTGSVFEAGWPAAMLLVAAAAWMRPRPVRHRALDGRRTLVLPLLFALLALTLLISDHFRPLNLLAMCLAWASLLAVIGRFAMTFFANLAILDDTRRDALTDALTGLGNRRRLLADLERTLAAGAPAALVLYDLNGFKAYNDTFGHPAGDALLARLGARLAAAAGPGSAYRMGGDEFCVLAPVTAEEAFGVVVRGTLALRERGEGFAISAAHGCVLLPEEAADAPSALGVADRRMYAHKAGGRRSADEQSRDVLLRALEEHHPDLGAHVHHVGRLAEAVGREVGLTGMALAHVRQAGDLHDVGKVAIPHAILGRPGPLAPEEWAFIERHTLIGERILSAAPALAPVGRLVRSSHERWDGRGYPDRLAGDAIPLGARIVAVCDAYDAMTSARPYKQRMSHAEAVAEVRRCAGAQFDPQVVEAFCRAVANLPAARGASAPALVTVPASR